MILKSSMSLKKTSPKMAPASKVSDYNLQRSPYGGKKLLSFILSPLNPHIPDQWHENAKHEANIWGIDSEILTSGIFYYGPEDMCFLPQLFPSSG